MNGSLDFWSQPAGAASWNQEEAAPAGQQNPFYSPALAWTGSSAVVTATDGHGDLHAFTQAADRHRALPQQLTANSFGTFGLFGAFSHSFLRIRPACA